MWHMRTSPYFCILIAGVEPLHEPDMGPNSMVPFQVFKTLTRCHHHLVPPRGTTYWNAIVSPRRSSLWSLSTYVPQGGLPWDVVAHLESIFALEGAVSLPLRRWFFPSSSSQLSLFIIEELKLALLIVSCMTFLLSPFARESHLDASQLLAIHSTSWHSKTCASRDHTISITPRHSGPSRSKPLSLFAAWLHFKSTFDALSWTCARIGSMTPPSLRFGPQVVVYQDVLR